MNNISVIVPVYNAFEVAERCLETVIKNSPPEVEILVIDDASPDGCFSQVLSKNLLEDSRVKFFRQAENGGYVKSANFGMRKAAPNDVILLNSDTEVPPRWVEKLRSAAYSREKVGSATPFTNKGLIAAFPRFCLPNELLPGNSLSELNRHLEIATVEEYPELPTSVGHCTYMKRAMLDDVGYFDEERFGLGYGEENDLSCRAQAKGWVDVLDEATYIYHKENTSFGDKKQHLSEVNSKILHRLYPHYFDRVSRFCSQDPIRPARMRIMDELVTQRNQEKDLRVLHIVHNGPHEPKRDPLGGTELHVMDLINNVKDVAHWSLTPLKTCYILTAHIPGAEREYILPLADTSLERIFSPDHFDIVHLHHSRWLDHEELCAALKAHGNYILSFHDYTLVCPRMHLYTPFHKACNRHECTQKCGYRDYYIESYREMARNLLSSARSLIGFSESTKELVQDALQETYDWNLIPHGIHANFDSDLVKIGQEISFRERPFKVAFLGYVPQHKGSLIIKDLVEKKQTDSGQAIEWHMIGKLFLEAPNVIQHGEYDRQGVQDLVKEVAPDLIMILSLCPETYCLTLDEAWSAGVPVLVTPLGAPAERVRASRAGWVLSELNFEAVWEQLQAIVSDPLTYNQVRERINATAVRPVATEAEDMLNCYLESLPKSVSSYPVLRSYLAQFGLLRAPKAAFHIRVLGKLATIAIYTLDSLKLRYHVQRLVTRLLPRKFYQVLKSAR